MGEREIRSWLMDMDGVLVHEEHAVPGADLFLARLRELELPFLVLTNNSMYTRRDLSARLRRAASTFPKMRSGRRRWLPRGFSSANGRAARRS